MRKRDYPAEQRCRGQKKGEAEPCPNPRRSCGSHCNADSERSLNGRCPTTPMGNGRCRMHGGKSLSGPASPRWETGRYSDVLEGGVGDGYERARQDERKTELGEEIALTTGRLGEALRENSGGAPAWARELTGLKRKMDAANRAARREPDEEKHEQLLGEAGEALGKILVLIERGPEVYDRERRVDALVEQRRRLAESERKRRQEEHEMWSRDRVLGIFEAYLQSIGRNVKDPKERDALVVDVQAINRAYGLQGGRAVEFADAN